MRADLHRLRHWLWMWLWHFDPVAARVAAWCRARARCFHCGKRLDAGEREHYETTCERCEGIAFHARQAAEAPICADTGAPKWPGDCWNVRCQLGKTCCRAHGVTVAPHQTFSHQTPMPSDKDEPR